MAGEGGGCSAILAGVAPAVFPWLVLEREGRVRCCVVKERVAVDLRSTVCNLDCSIVHKMHKCASGGSEVVERLCSIFTTIT
jgi:hypothetical protein